MRYKVLDIDHRQAAFFAKITASITHEMKNVLAIVKESSGLMQDILTLSGKDIFAHEDKLKDALHTIDDQIDRGVALTSRLNRFAHDSDEVVKSVDLNDLVAHLVALSTRFARLKKVDLVFSPSTVAISVRTRPLLLLMALFAGIEYCLAAIPPDGQIDIAVQIEGDKKQIVMSCRSAEDDLSDELFAQALEENRQWQAFLNLVEEIQGKYQLDTSKKRLSVSLKDMMDLERGNN